MGRKTEPLTQSRLRMGAFLSLQFDDLKVVELKAALRERGLPVSGVKAALIKRLQDHEQAAQTSLPDRDSGGLGAPTGDGVSEGVGGGEGGGRGDEIDGSNVEGARNVEAEAGEDGALCEPHPS